MKKKVISVLICLSLILSVSVCVSANQETENVGSVTSDSESKTYTLSLDDAIKMALDKDPAFMSADVKIKDAQRQVEQAKRNQKDMKGVKVRVSQGISSFALQRGYYVKQAELGVESAIKEKEQKVAQSAYSVTQQYYGVKLSERVLDSAKTGLSMAQENLKSAEMQFSLGLISEIDVNNAKLAVSKAQITSDKYERNLALARKSLAVTLHIEDENFTMNLTDDIEFKEFSADLNEDTKSALTTRYDVYMLESAVELATFMLDIADLYGGMSAEYSSANQAKVQSEVTRDYSKKMIGVSINSSYNAILDAKDTLKVAEETLELKKQEYNVAKIQYELGLITGTQLTALMNAVTTSQIELDNAKLTYKLAVEKYGYDITIGL